jgi:hypothetical protein
MPAPRPEAPLRAWHDFRCSERRGAVAGRHRPTYLGVRAAVHVPRGGAAARVPHGPPGEPVRVGPHDAA